MFSEGGGTRTHDLGIKSPLLYQLSYAPWIHGKRWFPNICSITLSGSRITEAATTMTSNWKRPFILLWRALRLRCPNCGNGPLFRRWLQMRKRCPVCRMRLERGEEGYQVGAYMFNIVAAELTFAAIFLGILISQWPSPPWDLLLYGGAVVMIIIPVLFYPVSKTLFLAFDLIFRPPSPEDFE